MAGTPRRGVAVGAMLLSGVLFSAMALCTKAARTQGLSGELPAAELTLFRFAFGALAVAPMHRRRGIDLWGEDKRGLVCRGIYGGIAVYAYFLALQYTSLTHAVLLNYTSLVFCPLFAAWWLKERVRPQGAAAIALAIGGIVLVTGRASGGIPIGDLFGIASGLLSGAAVTEVRRLRRSESAWSIFFYFSLLGVPISLVACFIQHPVWPTALGWLLMVGMGASSVAAQMLMTYGYGYVRAAEGGVMTLTQVVYSAVLSAWLFREPLTPSTLAGGVLILIPALWLSVGRAAASTAAIAKRPGSDGPEERRREWTADLPDD